MTVPRKATAALRMDLPPGDGVHLVAEWHAHCGGWGSTLCGRPTHRRWVERSKPVDCRICLRKLAALAAAVTP